MTNFIKTRFRLILSLFILAASFVFVFQFLNSSKAASAMLSCAGQPDGTSCVVGGVLVAGAPLGTCAGGNCIAAPNSAKIAAVADSKKLGKTDQCFEGWFGFTDAVNFNCTASYINSAIGYLGGYLIEWVVWIIELALDLNSKILAIPAVQIGWVLMRDVANMGFVLGIIVIAFATIIQQQTYGIKNLLVKLIIAAVLVNLSLPIAGVALDAAGIPTQFFVDKISDGAGTPGAFAETLAGAFNMQNIRELNMAVGKEARAADSLTSLGSIFFSVVMTFIILVTLGTVAIMLLIRFIAIGMLLIIMPMAILFWVFPKFSSNFQQWLQQFLRWTFFAPAVLFFIYLAIYTLEVKSRFLEVAVANLKSNPSGVAAILNQNTTLFGTDPALEVASMILMVGLTLGGLYVANALTLMGSMGIAKAAEGYAYGGARRIMKAPLGAGQALGGAALGAAQRYAAGGGAEPGEKTRAQRLAGWLAGKPFLGKLGEKVAGASEAQQGRIDKIYKDRFDGKSKDFLAAAAKNPINRVNRETAAALFRAIAEKGIVGKLDPSEVDAFIKASAGTGVERTVLKYNPKLAPKFGKNIQESIEGVSVGSYLDLAKGGTFNSDGLKGADDPALQTLLYSNTRGLGKIFREGSDEDTNAIKATFEKLQANRAAINDTSSAFYAGLKEESDKVKTKAAAIKKLEGLEEYFEKQPYAQDYDEEERGRKKGSEKSGSGPVDQFGKPLK